MGPLKKAIFTEIRNKHEKATPLDDNQLNCLLFHHPDGLRLSLTGFIVIKAIFTAYSFEIPDTLKSRHQLAMAQFTYPYILTPRRLILFSDMDAMTIKLSGGVEQYLENSYQSSLCNRQPG